MQSDQQDRKGVRVNADDFNHTQQKRKSLMGGHPNRLMRKLLQRNYTMKEVLL